MQVVGSQHVSQRRLSQQSGRVVSIFDVRDRDCRIRDAVVDDCIHGHGDGIFGQNLLRRHVEGQGPQVDLRVVLDAREDEEDAYFCISDKTEGVRGTQVTTGSRACVSRHETWEGLGNGWVAVLITVKSAVTMDEAEGQCVPQRSI